MAKPNVVVVTGANRGIGLAICEQILNHSNPIKLYACSRAGKDLRLKPQNGSPDISYPKLDITQSNQIKSLVDHIQSTDGHVDVLINNAGTQRYPNDPKEAEEIVHVNYYGTLRMCQAFLPLMAKQGRIVNVSSTASGLHLYSKEIQNQFRNPNLTLPDIDSMVEGYLGAVKSGQSEGWGDMRGYCFSKACVNSMTAILARENSNLAINCCCPGWVATEMGRIVGDAPKTPEEGARIPIRLAIGDIGDVTGKYWSNPGVGDTGYGQVMAR